MITQLVFEALACLTLLEPRMFGLKIYVRLQIL